MMLMGPWLALVVAIIIAVQWASHRRGDDREDVPLHVLDRRLAEGDLTVEQHAQRRQVLQEHGHGPRSRWAAWSGPVAVMVAVILLVWLGMTSWGASGWMSGHMGWRGSSSSTTETVEGARQVDVEAGELWFEPTTVQVSTGEPVNLRMVNTGDVFHDLTVPAADVVLAAEPGEVAIGSVDLSEAGRYEFYCSVPGHAQGGMRGTIVVTDAS